MQFSQVSKFQNNIIVLYRTQLKEVNSKCCINQNSIKMFGKENAKTVQIEAAREQPEYSL